MQTTANNEEVKQDILALYQRYFGSMMFENYKKFYADKDLTTILTSANELMSEYAGEVKGRELLSDIYKRYNITQN